MQIEFLRRKTDRLKKSNTTVLEKHSDLVEKHKEVHEKHIFYMIHINKRSSLKVVGPRFYPVIAYV